MKRQRIGHCLALAGIICIVGGFAPAVAQEELPGGTTLTFGLSSRLSVSDNYSLAIVAPGTSTILDTTLSFGYLTQTATSRFAFDVDGVLRAADIPGAGSDLRFDDTNAALSYSREGADSRLEITADYNRVNLDFLDPFTLTTLTDTDLIDSSGTLKSRNFDLKFETGITGPIGFGVELGHTADVYSDTTDPGLFDSKTNDIALTSRLRLSAVGEARLRLSQEDYTAQDVALTDRTTRALSLGLAYEMSPVTTLDVTAGVEKIKTVGLGTDRGTFGSVGLTRALANGSAGLVLDRSFGIEGGRTTLTANRSLDLPSGRLAVSLGVTRGELDGTAVIGSLAYDQALARGALTASFSRSVGSNVSGNDILTTNAALGYKLDLTSVSNLSLDFDFAEVENVGSGTTSNTNRSSVRAEYTRALTEDWDLSAGYRHQRLFTEGTGTANANTIFLTLGRDFSIRR